MNRDQQNFSNVQPPYDYQQPPTSDRFYSNTSVDNTTMKEEYNNNGNVYRSIGLDEREKRFE